MHKFIAIIGKIVEYDFDKFNKVVYILLKNGIFKVRYGYGAKSKMRAYEPLIIMGNILGFKTDLYRKNMFYFTSKNIFMYHLELRVTKTFYTTTRRISNIFPFVTRGYLK